LAPLGRQGTGVATSGGVLSRPLAPLPLVAALIASAVEAQQPLLPYGWDVTPLTSGRLGYAVTEYFETFSASEDDCFTETGYVHTLWIEGSLALGEGWGLRGGASASGVRAFPPAEAGPSCAGPGNPCGALVPAAFVPQTVWAGGQWGRCWGAWCAGAGLDLYSRISVDAHTSQVSAEASGPGDLMLQRNAAAFDSETPTGRALSLQSNTRGVWPRWIAVPQVHLGGRWEPRPSVRLELVLNPLSPFAPYAVRWSWNSWRGLWLGGDAEGYLGFVPRPSLNVSWRSGRWSASLFVVPGDLASLLNGFPNRATGTIGLSVGVEGGGTR
jgi:hypothetical protein